MLNYFCKQDLFINSNKVTVEMFLKTKNLCLSLTLFDFSEFQVIFSIPYQGKFCREKVTKFWLRDEDFPRRNFYRPNFFARWIFLPNEYHQRIKISRGNWRDFLFFFFPNNIPFNAWMTAMLPVSVKKQEESCCREKPWCKWWWLD